MALRTVRDYRDKWETVEKTNLEQDILRRIKSITADKEYKEHYENFDHQEMEKQIEEAIVPKEGEEPMDDETKQLIQRKLRFKLMSKGFYYQQQAIPQKPKFKEHKQEPVA